MQTKLIVLTTNSHVFSIDLNNLDAEIKVEIDKETNKDSLMVILSLKNMIF